MNKTSSSSFLLLIVLLFIASCNDGEESRSGLNNMTSFLNTNCEIIKLSDDSTHVAGLLEISSNIPEVELRWNLPEGANIDTTLTTLKLKEGKGELPIKWDKSSEEKTFGPVEMAYDGGVLISAGDKVKYVHLVWADRIDSTKVLSRSKTLTRATDPLIEPADIKLNPEIVPMDIVTGGEVYVTFTGTESVYFDHINLKQEYNIIKDNFPGIILGPQIIQYKWNDKGAPKFNFTADVLFIAEGISKVGVVNYIVPQDTPAVWEFISSIPNEGNTVLANEASIVVQVRTNNPWSLECDKGLAPIVNDYGTTLETRTLVMPLSNNTTPNPREITVLVKSRGNLQKTLTFMQMGQGQTGIFDFQSSNPVDKSTLPGESTSVDITVQSDVAWWIKCDCGKRVDYPASELGEKTGAVIVTENTTGIPRVVTITVGYGDTTVKTLSFIQQVSGIGPSATLVYDDSTLPAGNIPQAGATYTFIFVGTYTGSVQVRALLDGIAQTPGASVTNKQPETSIPANTLATTRNVTFQYKRADGEWTALPTFTNRVQDANNGGGAGELMYVSSDLPTGYIPAAGGLYTFNFEGSYTGQLRVRSVDASSGAVLFNGPIGTTHSPKTTVPANSGTTSRNIKFQYRLIDVANSPWLDLPSSTNRIQDAQSGGQGIITASSISPIGNIPEEGGSYYCTFTGGPGNVILRAMKVDVEVARTAEYNVSPSASAMVSINIPKLNDEKNTTITFEYSTDGGTTWKAIETRQQVNYSLGVNVNGSTKIPAVNGSVSFSVIGNYPYSVTVYARYKGEIIGQATALKAPLTIVVPIPDNTTGTEKSIDFIYTRGGDNRSFTIGIIKQDAQ